MLSAAGGNNECALHALTMHASGCSLHALDPSNWTAKTHWMRTHGVTTATWDAAGVLLSCDLGPEPSTEPNEQATATSHNKPKPLASAVVAHASGVIRGTTQ